MRLLIYSQMFEPEPGGRGLTLAKRLVAGGHQVEVLTGLPHEPVGKLYPGYKLRLVQREVMGNVPILRVALYPNHDRSAVKRTLKYMSFALSSAVIGLPLVRKADLTYVLSLPTLGCVANFQRMWRKTPFVFNIPDLWPESVIESGMIRSPAVRRTAERMISSVTRFVYKRAAAITVISPGFKRVLVERGVPENKIHVVYNWVDEDIYRPVPRDEGLQKQLGLAGRFNVLYAGNLGAFQGLDAVIRAAVRIQAHSSIQIVFLGSGQREAELKALAARLGADNVLFLGYRPVSAMPAIYALADVLLVHLRDLPFFSTTIPSKTQVSLACGRPMIMGVRGDAAALVQKARAGIVCEPENEADLADAMVRLSQMPREHLESMGASGRNYYLNELSLEVGTRRTAEILLRVAGAKGDHEGATGEAQRCQDAG